MYGILCCLPLKLPQISQARRACMRSLSHTLIVTLFTIWCCMQCCYVVYMSLSCILMRWQVILDCCINNLLSLLLPVYTVRKGTLVGGETTNREAVGTEFTKVGTWSIKDHSFLGAKHSYWPILVAVRSPLWPVGDQKRPRKTKDWLRL